MDNEIVLGLIVFAIIVGVLLLRERIKKHRAREEEKAHNETATPFSPENPLVCLPETIPVGRSSIRGGILAFVVSLIVMLTLATCVFNTTDTGSGDLATTSTDSSGLWWAAGIVVAWIPFLYLLRGEYKKRRDAWWCFVARKTASAEKGDPAEKIFKKAPNTSIGNDRERKDYMYCRNCSKTVHEKAVACPACGVPPRAEKKFCHNCGTQTNLNQVMCIKCGVSLAGGSEKKSKIAAGILALALGCCGAHQFYLGNTGSAIIRLVVSFVGGVFVIPTLVMTGISIYEGIQYLTMTDEAFEETYVTSKKAWF